MSRKFVVAAVQGGFAVCSTSVRGLLAMSEHATRDSAEVEAARLNRQHQVWEAAQVAAERSRRQARKNRSMARWFPTEPEYGVN